MLIGEAGSRYVISMIGRAAAVFGKSEEWNDYLWGRRYSEMFGARRFDPQRPFVIDDSRDTVLVFFHGLGDVAYGIPFFRALRTALNANGKKLIAAAEVRGFDVSNSAAENFLLELKKFDLFDEVITYKGSRAQYWKFYDWSSLDAKFGKETQILPFIYPTTHKMLTRLDAISWQYGIDLKISDYHLDIASQQPSPAFLEFIGGVKLAGPPVLVHFDARSSNYLYPYVENVVRHLIDRGQHVISLTPHELQSPSFTVLPVGKLSVLDTLRFIATLKLPIISISSISWPLSLIAKNEILGFFHLRSSDPHQFIHPRMRMFAASPYSARVSERVHLARPFRDFETWPDKRWLVEYNPRFMIQESERFLDEHSSSLPSPGSLPGQS
jgi:hypothetical protein